MPPDTPLLLDEPRWHLAAQALVYGCVDLSHDEDRVALLAAVCEGLGDSLYPAFLRVLALIGQHGDHAARAAVSGALLYALRTGRLPSGKRSAWGAATLMSDTAGFHRACNLGPIEYLCASHLQADPEYALSAVLFEAGARAMMDLISAHPDGRVLYCEKLLAAADDPITGVLTRQTRAALRVLAQAWAAGASSLDASADMLASIRGAVDAHARSGDLHNAHLRL